MSTGEPLIKQERTRSAVRFSLSLMLTLVSCAVIAQGQMRPMKNVTVSPRETANGQRANSAPDASTQGAPTQSDSAQDKSTRAASTKAAPALDNPARNNSTQETPARDTSAKEAAARDSSARSSSARETATPVTRTRARRVSVREPAVSASQPEKEVKEGTTDETASPAVLKTQSVRTGGMEMEEPPLMTSESKSEAKGEGRLNTLRAQIEDAKDERERGRLRRMLVDYLVSLDQKHEAITELRSMMREERFDPVGFYNIGNALARLGDTDTSIDAYRKAIDQRHGNYARALNNLGVMLLRQGRWDEAQEALTGALRQENYRYAEASYNLGRLYAARGEADLAIAEWRRTLSIQPDHADAALALARAYAEDGSPQRGLQVLDQFTERSGQTNLFTTARQQIMKEAATIQTNMTTAGAFNTTSAAGASADALRPLQVDAQTYHLLQRARAARESGRYEEAVGLYRRVLDAHKGFFPPANLEMSYALLNLKRTDEAIASLSAVTAREGAHYPIAYYHLARIYEGQGRLALAEQTYNQAQAVYGDTNPQLLLDLSRIREQSGNIAGALAALESFLRISERQGRTPDWAAAQLARLRQKLAATPAPK
jgi:tetratricopeptide (TPR) repeat protein